MHFSFQYGQMDIRVCALQTPSFGGVWGGLGIQFN